MEIVKCSDVEKVYGKGEGQTAALRGIDFSMEKGSFVAVVGASGSGKSTLLHILGSVEKPTKGRVEIDGVDMAGLNAAEAAIFRRRKVGLIYQFYNLIPTLTVEKNILMPLLLDKRKPNREYFDRIVTALGLTDKLEALPHQLSGGQRQRVAFARALAPNPQLLLLDEPFAAIDAKVRRELRCWLKEMIGRVGITSIFVTHDQEEAMEVADTIIITNQGRIEQTGTPDEICLHPQTEFVKDFIDIARYVAFHYIRKSSLLE